jgi:hypothetical protein
MPPPITPFSTVLTNAGSDGLPFVRFDVEGNALDAHEGQLQRFGETYYLYGTSYDCRFVWQERGTPFCGFKVYSSPDLVHWTDRGFLFDARTPVWQARCDGATFGCYRPHVAYNPRRQRYVLWINGYDAGVGFHVFQSESPLGPFVEAATPKLAVNDGLPPGVNNGDHDLFVDEDGQAYLAYTDWKRQGDIVVERLDEDYLSGTGRFARLGVTGSEGPALFRREGRYYLTLTDHTCANCTTGTGYMTAADPLGPWTGRDGAPINLSADSCGGPSAAVATLPGRDGPLFLLQSDLWQPGDRSQALANHYWGPLSFAPDGAIERLRCQPTVELELTAGQPGAAPLRAHVDQTSGSEGFRLECDIGRVQRLQTFTAGRSGRLARVGVTTFARGPTSADLELDVVEVDARGHRGATLGTSTVPAIRVGRTAREVSFDLERVELVAGERYGFVMRTSETEGCYGFAYRDDGTHALGQQQVSEDEGESWDLEPGRTLKFTTTMP